MNKSIKDKIDNILIGKKILENIDKYVDEVLEICQHEFNSPEEMIKVFTDYINSDLSKIIIKIFNKIVEIKQVELLSYIKENAARIEEKEIADILRNKQAAYNALEEIIAIYISILNHKNEVKHLKDLVNNDLEYFFIPPEVPEINRKNYIKLGQQRLDKFKKWINH